ncbi:MAG: 50S ribosome-binding GTPase [Planctomycetes bacterium]|nr:50S ribosome-binding GTPase [Planctomycetota bacterium]
MHTVGCLPVLRATCAKLITLGARRALPGEFTARAFLAGKLDATQVESVLSLVSSANVAAARRAARGGRDTVREVLDDLRERATDLLARLEAGLDFAEEEDVRFVTSAEMCAELDGMLASLDAVRAPTMPHSHADTPHVALAGLPNAGKSTLFNALLGYERAIVSPVLGTTRDVLSAEIEVDGTRLVVQDCAGLGESSAELEMAAHYAAEQAADRADIVLWVHDATVPWEPREGLAGTRIQVERRVLVWSKMDKLGDTAPPECPLEFAERVQVSGRTGQGLREFRAALARRANRLSAADGAGYWSEELEGLAGDLRRAREACAEECGSEIAALELRIVCERLAGSTDQPLAEEVLRRIFAEFCVGK